MKKQDRERILTEAIERLLARETLAEASPHGDDATVGDDSLRQAIMSMQHLSTQRLTDAQRRQARMTLRTAMLQQNRRAAPSRWETWQPFQAIRRLALPRPLPVPALAAVLAAALFLIMTITVVAASTPGSKAYAVRVVIERAPVLLQPNASAKTTAELQIADRRLADLEIYLAHKEAIAPAAIEALLEGDRAVVGRLEALSPAERIQAADHLAGHAARLATLAKLTKQPSARATLQAAATQVETLAQQIKSDPAPDTPETAATPEPATAPLPLTPLPLSSPTTSPAPPGSDATPLAPHAGGNETSASPPLTPGKRATTLAQTATVEPTKPATSTPIAPTASPQFQPTSSPVPGRRATALAQTPTATPTAAQTAEPTPTETATPRPDTPVPGRRATALAQTPTSPATPMTTTPVPGRRATQQAQTATPVTEALPAPATEPSLTLTPVSP